VRAPRHPLRSERGFAVPVALAILLVAVLLSGVAASFAIQTTHLTRRDSNSKSALEAANAGLRAAVYRLNAYQPAGNQCPTPTLTGVGGSGAPSSTLCAPDGPDTSNGLGNGATYSYWVSEAMGSGDKCTGPTVSNGIDGVVQRCITALGTANGVQARVQERVAAYTSTPTFPTAIFGTKSVTIGNNVTIVSNTPGDPALLGTNGQLTIGSSNGGGGGTTLIDGYQLPPGATASIGANVTNVGPTTGINAPYAVPTPSYPFPTATDTKSPYDSSTTFQGGTCNMAEAQQYYSWSGSAGTWQQTNCDYEIQRGISYPTCLNGITVIADCDATTGSVSWDAAGHNLYLGNNSSLVLEGGYYYFCSLYLSNNSQITVVGGQATIFIDSPYDTNSAVPTKCANTPSPKGVAPGTFTMNQNSSINPGGSALNAQILVYGDPGNPTANVVNLTNNASSSFALSAPYSVVNMLPSNNSTFIGAIVGYEVTLGQASHFTYEADTHSFQTQAAPIYYPSFWEQCAIAGYSSGAPTSGC